MHQIKDNYTALATCLSALHVQYKLIQYDIQLWIHAHPACVATEYLHQALTAG